MNNHVVTPWWIQFRDTGFIDENNLLRIRQNQRPCSSFPLHINPSLLPVEYYLSNLGNNNHNNNHSQSIPQLHIPPPTTVVLDTHETSSSPDSLSHFDKMSSKSGSSSTGGSKGTTSSVSKTGNGNKGNNGTQKNVINNNDVYGERSKPDAEDNKPPIDVITRTSRLEWMSGNTYSDPEGTNGNRYKKEGKPDCSNPDGSATGYSPKFTNSSNSKK